MAPGRGRPGRRRQQQGSARLVDGTASVAVRDQGAGLGLAIVAGIAGEHGGGATAANAPGGGALFTITLPLRPASE